MAAKNWKILLFLDPCAHHLLINGIPDVPDSVIINFRELENVTSHLFERQN
jgi:hypothetical protein